MARIIVRDRTNPNDIHDFPAASRPYDVPNNAFVQALQDYLESYANAIATVGIVNHVPTTTPASDTIAPTDIYNETILGGTLLTAGVIRRTLFGYISTDADNPGGLTIDVSFGGQFVNLVTVDDGTMPPSLDHAPFAIHLDIAAKDDENIQVLYCEYIQDGNITFLKRLGLTVDSTIDQDLDIVATMTYASANNIVAIESGG